MSELLKYGNKILRKNLELVKLPDESLKPIIDEMAKACDRFHGYGIAANQIGWDAKVSVIKLNHITNEDKIIVLINPELAGFSENEVYFDESCLSLPTLKVKIRRSNEIRIRNHKLDGSEEIIEAKDLLARVIWHELDHLKGKLILDYMTPFEKSMIENKLKRIKRGSI